MDELKSCPFCGGTKLFVGTDEEINMLDEEDATGYYAVCCSFAEGGCGASSGFKPSINSAIKSWNQRNGEGESE